MPPSAREIVSTIEENRDELRQFKLRRLGLFGSFARNEARPDSDIDFLVEFSEKSFDAYMGLKLFLQELFRRPVDLVMPNTLKPRLRDAILRETVYAERL